jgi:cytochrome b
MRIKVRIWDLPTRLFHWALVLCLVGLITTAQIGGNAMDWHFRFGYGVLTLLLFRFIWGFMGGYWSRFSSFFYSPAAIYRYVRDANKPSPSLGHNPLGAASVYAMLILLLMQVGTGLVSDDEIAAAGPLSKYVASAWVSQATFYHSEIGKRLILALVGLHLAAVLFHQFKKREDLVRPMISGDKALDSTAASSRDDAKSRALAMVLLALCAALVAGLLLLAR